MLVKWKIVEEAWIIVHHRIAVGQITTTLGTFSLLGRRSGTSYMFHSIQIDSMDDDDDRCE
jgi:hypothetical protein